MSVARTNAVVRALVSRLPRSTASNTTAVPVRAIATTRVAARVARARTDGGSSGLAIIAPELVAGTSKGTDARAAERRVNLAAQGADVHLDDVRVAIEREIPDVAEDVELCDDLAFPAGQVLQHSELFCRQWNVVLSSRAPPRRRVEGEVADDEYRL